MQVNATATIIDLLGEETDLIAVVVVHVLIEVSVVEIGLIVEAQDMIAAIDSHRVTDEAMAVKEEIMMTLIEAMAVVVTEVTAEEAEVIAEVMTEVSQTILEASETGLEEIRVVEDTLPDDHLAAMEMAATAALWEMR